MWRNYLLVGWRALTRHRTYALINIFGLALGLAACLLLILYVRYETTYENWLPEAERVYQVQSISLSDPSGPRVIQIPSFRFFARARHESPAQLLRAARAGEHPEQGLEAALRI